MWAVVSAVCLTLFDESLEDVEGDCIVKKGARCIVIVKRQRNVLLYLLVAMVWFYEVPMNFTCCCSVVLLFRCECEVRGEVTRVGRWRERAGHAFISFQHKTIVQKKG